MQSDPKRIQKLLSKYLEGTLSEEETAELEQWRQQDPQNDAAFRYATTPQTIQEELRLIGKYHRHAEDTLSSILSQSQSKKNVTTIRWRRRLAAAAIFGVISLTGLVIYQQQQKRTPPQTTGRNDASSPRRRETSSVTLVLSNGQEIPLDDNLKGVIASENGTEVKKSGDVIYYAAPKQLVAATAVHTLKTAGHKEFEVILSDGTSVILNAFTEFRYPTAFTGKTRNVELLTGEAYFRITKDKTKPFYVKVNGKDIMVTGTEFNINAYGDEVHVSSHLFEGAITASKDTLDIRLKPGQELRYDSTTRKWKLVKVDLEEVPAWHNGRLKLQDVDMPTLMRIISRRYNVEVIYKNGYPEQHVNGTITNRMGLSDVLKVLRECGVNTKLEGRKLYVL